MAFAIVPFELDEEPPEWWLRGFPPSVHRWSSLKEETASHVRRTTDSYALVSFRQRAHSLTGWLLTQGHSCELLRGRASALRITGCCFLRGSSVAGNNLAEASSRNCAA